MADTREPGVEAGQVPTLSLCMIVKNEAHFLGRCLAAVRDYVDEIVVVETGSTDQTLQIAEQYADKVLNFKWVDDFSAARNFSLEQASGDWILVLDADELLTGEDLDTLRELIRDTTLDAFFLQQYNYSNNPMEPEWQPVQEQTLFTHGYQGFRKNRIARLFRNGRGICYHGRIHEVIDPCLEAGQYADLEIPLHHHIDSDPSKPRKERSVGYLRLMEEELARQPDGRLYATAASVYMYQLGDYRKALEYYQAAADHDYKREASLEGVAEGHYRLGELHPAYNLYMQLYDSGHATFSLCTNLANLMVKSGQHERAIHLLQQSLTLSSADADTTARIQHNIRHLQSRETP